MKIEFGSVRFCDGDSLRMAMASSDALSQFDILTLLRKYSDKSAFRLVAPGVAPAVGTNFGISVLKSGDLNDFDDFSGFFSLCCLFFIFPSVQ